MKTNLQPSPASLRYSGKRPFEPDASVNSMPVTELVDGPAFRVKRIQGVRYEPRETADDSAE